jgi:hypothetical protein
MAACAPACFGQSSVSYSDSIGLQTTTWDDTVTIPMFDPALGELVGIDFSLTGQLDGSAAFESLDNSPAEVMIDFSGEITLYRPDLTEIVTAIPLLSNSMNVTAYDGLSDFGGTSGATFNNLQAEQTESISSGAESADLPLFTGPGTIDLPVGAAGTSMGSGGGNLILQFLQEGAAAVEVTYHYVPEPATMGLVLVSSLVTVFRRRR